MNKFTKLKNAKSLLEIAQILSNSEKNTDIYIIDCGLFSHLHSWKGLPVSFNTASVDHQILFILLVNEATNA